MNLIPIIDNREYLILDENFNILQTSPDIKKYSDRPEQVVPGRDVRLSFPELIGLEETCNAILTKNQENFILDGISRTVDDNTNIYFDIYIKSIEDKLIIFIEDVTELMLLRQSLIQRVNEAEVTLEKLKRFEYCTNKILASMRDVLFITTASGAIERVNKSTIEISGYKKSELLNSSINEIIQDVNFNHQQIYTSLTETDNTLQKIEVLFPNKQNKTVQIEFNCFVVPTEIEGYLNCVYIGRDITARKRAELEMRRALAKEKELRELKSSFISMASHEFRNPLSSILLCVNSLEAENMSRSERQFYLQSIQSAAMTMQSLLEDILIISQSETGRQKLNPTPLNLADFCQQIIQEIKSTHADRIINLDDKIGSSLVCLDKKSLRHILTNLLSNALKYSPQEEAVDLNIALSTKQTEVTIEVGDRGMGIPPESQKHLFESFYRASNVGDIPGTGLGLSIVKKSVDLHGGTIMVDSKINQGTTIKVTLPIDKARASS